MSANFDILTQRYVVQFECIADRCEDDCCGGWNIPVKPSDESRLLAALGPTKLVQHIVRTPNSAQAPAAMKLCSNERCSLQGSDGLCQVHSKHGQQALPDICADYPRRLVQVDNRLEITAALSCPEVSRLVLFSEDALAFEHGDPSMLPRPKPAQRMLTRSSSYYEPVNDVRSFLIQLLTLPHYTLKERLLMLAFFAKSTRSFFHLEAEGNLGPPLLQSMQNFSNSAFRAELINAFSGEEIPSHLGMSLVERVLHLSTSLRKQPKFTGLIAKAVTTYFDGDSPERPTRVVWEMYREREARMLDTFGDEFELIFGNFAIHFVMHAPYTNSENLLTYAILLLSQIAMQKFLLVSYPGADRDIESLRKAAVEVIYQCQRTFLHTEILPHLYGDLKDNGYVTGAGAMLLTKF